jgi:hypothetical protein
MLLGFPAGLPLRLLSRIRFLKAVRNPCL